MADTYDHPPCCGPGCEGVNCWECRGTGHPHAPGDSAHETLVDREVYDRMMSDPNTPDSAPGLAARLQGVPTLPHYPNPEHEVIFTVEKGWPTPNACRRAADALDKIAPAQYGSILRAYADAEDKRFHLYGPIPLPNAKPKS